MKHLMTFALIAMAIFCVSCTKQSPYAGTNWTNSELHSILQLKEDNVATVIDEFKNQRYDGSYSVSGSIITFIGLSFNRGVISYSFDYGEVNGNMMYVTLHSGGKKQSYVFYMR